MMEEIWNMYMYTGYLNKIWYLSWIPHRSYFPFHKKHKMVQCEEITKDITKKLVFFMPMVYRGYSHVLVYGITWHFVGVKTHWMFFTHHKHLNLETGQWNRDLYVQLWKQINETEICMYNSGNRSMKQRFVCTTLETGQWNRDLYVQLWKYVYSQEKEVHI